MTNFDNPFSVQYFTDIIAKIKEHDVDICAAELYAPLDVRLERNVTENRLKHKPSKKHIEVSNERIIRDSENGRFLSEPGELPFENHMQIDNTNVPPELAARMIKERFGL
jgi:hypothetical protein